MANQSKGLRHLSLRKRIYQKYEPYPNPDKIKRFYDKFIYVVVILAPIINLPQLFTVWLDKNAAGVSVFSWFGFSLISVAWMVYGIIHKDKHIIFMNIVLMIIQALIAIGALLYG
ncbi:MAG: SemiSWEET family transporter [Candidatus Aenigmatarchaeota archaeon]